MAQAPLDPVHFPVIGFVVVAEQMQRAVQHQYAEFARQAARQAAGVAPGHGRGSGDVAEIAHARLAREAQATLDEMLDRGNGASRQAVVYEANHDLREVVREILDATVPEPAEATGVFSTMRTTRDFDGMLRQSRRVSRYRPGGRMPRLASVVRWLVVQLVVGATVGRSQVERIVGLQVGLHAEREADEASRPGERAGCRSPGDLGLGGSISGVVEFGAGSATKTPLLLEAIHPATYVPVDISGDYLRDSASEVAERFPEISVEPVVVDFARPFDLPASIAGLAKLGFFPGSTIGNFVPRTATDLLRSWRDLLGDLAPAEWERDSLCAGWTVRHVAAHVISSPQATPGAVAVALVRARGSFDRCIDEQARRWADRPTAAIVADFRRLHGSRRHPDGGRGPGAGSTSDPAQAGRGERAAWRGGGDDDLGPSGRGDAGGGEG